MASKQFILQGKCAWANGLFKLDETPWGKLWSVEFYPDNVEEFKRMGVQLREVKNPLFAGETGYRLKRYPERNGYEFGPPTIVDFNNEPWDNDVAIGNGSTVLVNITVYETRNGYGPKGHRLNGVKVLELVPYEKRNGNGGLFPSTPITDDNPLPDPQPVKKPPVNKSVKTKTSVTPVVEW